jgi:hypothetical protein
MENQLSRFSVTELKALVYDELAKAEQAQANIRILNQELRNRLQPAQGGVTNPDGSQPTVTSADFSGAPDA